MIGKTLGRYHIREQVGEGGMATVYKAFDTRLERAVALKVILPHRRHAPEFLKRFDREAKALAKMAHPNVVRVLDYGEHDGLPFLVMEYTPGGTLKERLGKAIPWHRAVHMLLPIARALTYAHERKIIHRDVKPSNIIFSELGEPMLSDFGIAKVLEAEKTWDVTGTGVGIGTPEYMAPEQGIGKGVDHRADIYALGVVFYEMITGRTPYQADTPLAVLMKHINDPLPQPSEFVANLPERVEQVLIKALAKEAEDRFQSMGELVTALANLLERTDVTVKEVVQVPDEKRPHPAVIAGLAALAVVVVAGLTWGISKLPGSSDRAISSNLVTPAEEKGPVLESTLMPEPTDTTDAGTFRTQTARAYTNATVTQAVYNARLTGTALALTPTATPSLAPTRRQVGTSEVIADALVMFEDNFDDPLSSAWERSVRPNVVDGVLQIRGYDRQGDWFEYVQRVSDLKEGDAVLVKFRYESGTVFEIFTEVGGWGDPSMRRWGVSSSQDLTMDPNIIAGTTNIYEYSLTGNLRPQPNHWYFLLLKIGGKSEFIARVWDSGNENISLKMQAQMDTDWEKTGWWVALRAFTGTLEIDLYQELYVPTY